MEFYENLGKNVIDLVKRKYSYLSVKTKEFEQIKEGLDENMSKVSNNNEALKVLINYLSLFNDDHIKFLDEEGYYHAKFNLKESINFNNTITDSYLSNKKIIGPITLGELEDILYVRANSFNEKFSKDFKKLYTTNPQNKKFIIDLRPNSGGNDSLATPLIEFLLGNEQKQLSYYSRKRISENHPSILSEFNPEYIYPVFNHLPKKVAVLIGNKTCSASELVTLKLTAIPDSISIGDISGGVSGIPLIYLLDGNKECTKIGFNDFPNNYESKFAINLPSKLIYKRNKELVQNNGITPDILIPSNKSIIDGRDLVLEQAINKL
ncbi:MAG: S41 family peptidase [Candidatus Nanoarchaeia archaeon]|nr:S41 family peptidase [Candidatus Nanoarchaeia archaeon]